MAKVYKFLSAHWSMLQTQLGAGISCGKAENALKELNERAHKTGDEKFIEMNDIYLKLMEAHRDRAEKALGEYRAAAAALLSLHANHDGK